MNERYLFRGKRIDNGEWVQGFYALDNDIPTIIMPKGSYWHVGPATVGQCTGLRDKNGTLIFEGDVLRGIDGDKIRVLYNASHCAYMTEHVGIPQIKTGWLGNQCSLLIEVIGNVYDNPELLEAAQ